MPAFGRGQPLQIDAVIGDEFLVCGDHALARLKRAPYPRARGIEAARQLDDHVGIGGQHGFGILAPDHILRSPVHALASHAAVEDVGELKLTRLRLRKNARHRTAHCAESEQSDTQGALDARLDRKINNDRRCGRRNVRHRMILFYDVQNGKYETSR